MCMLFYEYFPLFSRYLICEDVFVVHNEYIYAHQISFATFCYILLFFTFSFDCNNIETKPEITV